MDIFILCGNNNNNDDDEIIKILVVRLFNL